MRESTAGQLRSTIATWYNTLRVISIVGLLSVLVYVGIRIILSSTSQEKAKYKKMITDWLVAMCLLFILHYIMTFTMQITDSILSMFAENGNIIGSNDQDVIMSTVREKIGEIDGKKTDFVDLFSYIVVYIVLVIFTIMFILQYLKRLLWLAFLTMIAPLITLTYPIDKIKDGKAQAFTMWIREYIFNALLPIIHIVLYYMLVGSAMDFITTGGNWLYAIVAVAFLMPAEKFFRKMFGFDSATSASQLNAAAGGALVMNAINKMGQKSGKQAAGKASGSGDSGSSGGGAPTRYISNPGGGSGGPGGGLPANRVPGNSTIGTSGSGFNTNVSGANAKGKWQVAKGAINGVKTLGGKYFNRANGIKLAKGAGRMARKGIIGAAGAATLGTVGVAAGVASGDLGKALQYGAAGAGAGFMGANHLGDKATEFGAQNVETFKEGALGTEEYNTRKSVKELTMDNDFNKLCKQMGATTQSERETLIRHFHSNGITKSEDIKKAISAGVSTSNTNQHELIAAAKINQEAKRYGHKRKDIEDRLRASGVTNQTDLDRAMSLIDLL